MSKSSRYLDDEKNSKMQLDSDNVSLSDTQSTSTSTSAPKRRRSRPTRRKVSMATRRRSRLLYLEKYGLNQPGWHTGSHDDIDSNEQHHDNNSDDNNMEVEYTDEPEEIISTNITPATFAPNTQAIADISVKRPVSIRNYVQSSTFQKRPTRFVKPQKSNSDAMSFPATEFKHVQQLENEYTEKVYMEGYLHKRNDLNSNGSACGTKKWSLWYVELCGPVLTLWDNSTSTKEVYPQYINITDSTVQLEDRLTAETRPNLFSLNSAGANRFLLQAADTDSLSKWILAIRLSCFECSRIQEIYTRAFITRPQYKSLLATGSNKCKMEGFLQVRFPGATGWKKFWAVVSNTKVEKKLFSKKVIPTGGQVMFYESKKSKFPVMTLQNVVQVYTVYPESPKLINMATLFKIEGSLYKNKSRNQQLVSASSSALLMTSNTNELVQWLVGSFDAFKLYGRPGALLDDSHNQAALNFAEDIKSNQRLFLEPQEVDSVNVRTNLLDNKKEFTAILLDKMLHPSLYNTSTSMNNTLGDNRRLSAASTNTTTTTTSSVNGRDRRPSDRSLISNQLRNGLNQPTQLRTVTCASDVSDEDDDNEDEHLRHVGESDSDSDESLFKLGVAPIANKKKSTNATSATSPLVKPITPNTSKSNSEISEVSPSAPAIAADMFLPLVTVVDNSFANSILSETNHHFNTQQHQHQQYPITSEETTTTSDSEEGSSSNHTTTKKKPFYAAQHYGQQRTNSMMSAPQWPMYSSTASIVTGDYHSNDNWETSSVDPHMMMGNDNANYFSSRESFHQPYYASSMVNGYNNNDDNNMSEDDEDDNTPIASMDKFFTQNSLLDQVGNDRVTAKNIEQNARATGQPFVQVPVKKVSPRAGLLGVISEKEREKENNDLNRGRGMMDEQMLMRERMMMEQRQQQIMMQQYMQQQYASGMIPMMMPMVDPRMMPMMDPRMMGQPMMMMDPRLMSQPQMMPMPSPSTSSTFSGQQQYNNNNNNRSRYQQSNDNQSISGVSTSSGRPNNKRLMSSSASIANSIHSAAGSRYAPSARRTRNH